MAHARRLAAAGALVLALAGPRLAGQVRAWEGTLDLPTYPWSEDVHPRFQAMPVPGRGGAPWLYPYTMQDHLSRTKVNRAYRALFLENEYLRVTCLPELGGRLHSVLDKTNGQEMFHCNQVIKPGMIAMRGAWISGGVEWNAGPQGHTVTCVSPVDALAGRNPDGSCWLEIADLEMSQRTRWTVRLTLHPGRAYLDERIRLFNPTDALSPYYFWNCTAFPNRPGTRFIFPMTLGTDHSAQKFFNWPVHEGRDLSWLRNHVTWASIFARDCEFDFFGAYDVDADRGLVQAADHHALPGKKAWTWGNWDFGLVSQQNLTDDDGPYIEVQSGPLPTQSDYGALWPRQEVAWQEWWYPVHGLGDGFEFATRDVAVQTRRAGGQLEVRLIATGALAGTRCLVSHGTETLHDGRVDLGPEGPKTIILPDPGAPVEIRLIASSGAPLLAFTSPLPVPRVEHPAPVPPTPDEQRSAEEWYLAGRKADLELDRERARAAYEQALARDPGCVSASRGLGVLALEVGDYQTAVGHLEPAVRRDPQDGLSWYFLGVCRLKLDQLPAALRCADQAARCFGTAGLGHDLAGRAFMRMHDPGRAAAAFAQAAAASPHDRRAWDHRLLADLARGDARAADEARQRLLETPTDLLPRALLALRNEDELRRFAADVEHFVGQPDFALVQLGLELAELGLYAEAARVVAGAVRLAPPDGRVTGALPLYHAACWAARAGDAAEARDLLAQAHQRGREGEFASDPDSAPALEFAIAGQPDDAAAHLHLGNLYAHLGRLDDAVARWETAARLDPAASMALRNLGLHAWVIRKDLPRAAELYRRALAARPTDQTLARDLAEVLIADGQRPAAIQLLAALPADPPRRADVLLLLAQSYLDEQQFDELIALLAATPYFVAWEGQTTTWLLFSAAHLGRGRVLLERGDAASALAEFDLARTYPANLGVGRPDQPEHAAALYWRGRALAALGRTAEAGAAWEEGARGVSGSDEQNRHRELCKAALSEK